VYPEKFQVLPLMLKLNQFLVYDELPLWSAPFGLVMLDILIYEPGINILDIGSGSGFPMLEIAERAGNSCRVYGVDPSEDALFMINRKIKLKGIGNAKIVKAYAEKLPFKDSFFHRIVSNNGLNNVRDLKKSLDECFRVSQRGAQMVLTMNLPGTLGEFYDVFEEVLSEYGLDDEIRKMKDHIFEKRKSVEYLKSMIEQSGFSIRRIKTDGFKIKYLDGISFFNHYFIRNAFLNPWKAIVPEQMHTKVFKAIEMRLNTIAKDCNKLIMSVPFACLDCLKS